MAKRSVLVVEYDDRERARLSALLERSGFDVIPCPGPTAPDYSCVGGRGLPCSLAREADVVVLDMRLASDVIMRGTPAWELLLYYMEHGKRIVALSNGEDAVHPLSDARVTAIRRPADARALIGAVRDLLSRIPEERGDRGIDIAR